MEISSVASFLDYLDKIRVRTKRLIQVIPTDKMDWAYMPGKFTIGDQVRHIAAIERYLFAETIAGRKSAYHGCGKDLAEGYDATLKYFDELHRQSLEIFGQLKDEDLQTKCIAPGGDDIVKWKWLRAMIEHEIHHRAQLYLYLNILGVQTPPIFGLTAEEVERLSDPTQ